MSPRNKYKSIVFLTRYHRDGASSRVRSFQYEYNFTSDDYHVRFMPFHGRTYISHLYKTKSRSIYRYFLSLLRRMLCILLIGFNSVVFIEKELFPQTPWYFDKLFFLILRVKHCFIIVDYDDATFLTYTRFPPAYSRFFTAKYTYLASHSDYVTVGSSMLREWALEYTSKVKKIASTCTPQRSDTELRPLMLPTNLQLKVGWIGTPHTSRYLDAFLEKLVQTDVIRRISIRTLGYSPSIAICDQGINLVLREWSQEAEACFFSDIDVGLMPVPHESFELYKSGYKVIQYMANGVVPLASRWGENSVLIDNLKNGLLFDSFNEARSHFDLLLNNPSLLPLLSKAATDSFEQKLSLSKQYSVIKTILPTNA